MSACYNRMRCYHDGRRFLAFESLESEVVHMDIQTIIELLSLVIAAIGLGIYIERKK